MKDWRVVIALTASLTGIVVAASEPAARPSATSPTVLADKDAELADAFARRVEHLADAVDGIVSYQIVDLSSGREFGRKATEPFPTASAIKIGILYELFRQADEGRVSLDTAAPLNPATKVGGSGILQHLGQPALSPRDHAVLMIAISDNTATNMLIDVLGMDAINTRMRALGASTFALQRRMMDAAAASEGRENLASPADLVRVLDALRRGTGLESRSRDAALEMLGRSAGTPLRAGVPAGVAVAAKPGGLDGVRTEVGFVDLKGRPYLIAVMATYLADEDEGERAITAISRAAFQYFSRLSRAGSEGRLR